MKCPHCQTEYHPNTETFDVGCDVHYCWILEKQICPACSQLVLQLVCLKKYMADFGPFSGEELRRSVAWPRSASRPNPPKEVPAEFCEDYIEASLILGDSPKASAAISRRCLQHLLREKAGVKPADLATEITEVLDSNQLPSFLAEAIDAIRIIGNFAAHPIKSKATGEILAVEPGEAEWTLDVLEGLFDFYFIQPLILQQKREALNVKLAEAGKPPLKQ